VVGIEVDAAMMAVAKEHEKALNLLLNTFCRLAIDAGFPEVAKQIDNEVWL
jgi:hypothetical protein